MAQALRARYHTPAPALDYDVARRPYGVLATLGDTRRAILDDGARASDLAGLVADEATVVWVEDRDQAERWAPTLARVGYDAVPATTYVALVGDVRASAPEVLALRRALDVEDFARRKLTYFADGAVPNEAELAREVATRERERDLADFYLVEVDGDVSAILAAYRGEDATAYLLASDPSRRSRGVASGALAAWVASTPARSHVINALDGGRPGELYRRLGFSDEVYWYRRFTRT